MAPPYRVVVVGGPTASGKSALGVKLARALGGEIVNLDSVQVYKGLDIGSAKLTRQEQEGIPHHLLDIFEPSAPANVAAFRLAAMEAMEGIVMRGNMPILVGGSGMYLTVLLHGLAEVPAADESIRSRVAAMSPPAMYKLLSEVDPATAGRLHERDTQRVARALEIWFASGEPPSAIFERHKFNTRELIALSLVLCLPRDELYDRINRRSRDMVSRGLVEETHALMARYGESAVFETLGYKQAREVVNGTLLRDELADTISLHTRRFAKRQMTYWRNEPRKRGWSTRPDGLDGEEVSGFESFSERAQKHMKPFRALSFTNDAICTAVKQRLMQEQQESEVWYVRL